MRCSKLTKRIQIQKLIQVKDEYGELTNEWETFKEVWAEVRPVTGKQFIEAMQINSEITHQVNIRYLKGAEPSMRVLYKDRVFNILYVMNFNEGNESMQMLCKELI